MVPTEVKHRFQLVEIGRAIPPRGFEVYTGTFIATLGEDDPDAEELAVSNESG
jgi:hypothetical protein